MRLAPLAKRFAFATPPAATSAVQALGFTGFSVGHDGSAREAILRAGFSLDGLSIDEQMILMGRYWVLGDNLIERVRDLVELGSSWRPDELSAFVRMLAPFAPHLAEELWSRLGHPYSVHQQAFPDVVLRETRPGGAGDARRPVGQATKLPQAQPRGLS